MVYFSQPNGDKISYAKYIELVEGDIMRRNVVCAPSIVSAILNREGTVCAVSWVISNIQVISIQ